MTETRCVDHSISTNELADLLHVKPPSIYKRLCITGSYWGIHPTKMPNGRLLWPADAIDLIKQAQELQKPAQSPVPPLYGDQAHVTGILFCAPRAEVQQ